MKKKQEITIENMEVSISEVVNKPDVADADMNYISGLLGRILTNIFASQERETGLRSWTVDDMYPSEIQINTRKISLTGGISWLCGGGICVRYQADIARDTDPLLYSVKLKTKHDRQIMYIGKTYEGWVFRLD